MAFHIFRRRRPPEESVADAMIDSQRLGGEWVDTVIEERAEPSPLLAPGRRGGHPSTPRESASNDSLLEPEEPLSIEPLALSSKITAPDPFRRHRENINDWGARAVAAARQMEEDRLRARMQVRQARAARLSAATTATAALPGADPAPVTYLSSSAITTPPAREGVQPRDAVPTPRPRRSTLAAMFETVPPIEAPNSAREALHRSLLTAPTDSVDVSRIPGWRPRIGTDELDRLAATPSVPYEAFQGADQTLMGQASGKGAAEHLPASMRHAPWADLPGKESPGREPPRTEAPIVRADPDPTSLMGTAPVAALNWPQIAQATEVQEIEAEVASVEAIDTPEAAWADPAHDDAQGQAAASAPTVAPTHAETSVLPVDVPLDDLRPDAGEGAAPAVVAQDLPHTPQEPCAAPASQALADPAPWSAVPDVASADPEEAHHDLAPSSPRFHESDSIDPAPPSAVFDLGAGQDQVGQATPDANAQVIDEQPAPPLPSSHEGPDESESTIDGAIESTQQEATVMATGDELPTHDFILPHEEAPMSSQPQEPIDEHADAKALTANEGMIEGHAAQQPRRRTFGWIKLQPPAGRQHAPEDEALQNDGKPPLAFMQPGKPNLVQRLRNNPKQAMLVAVGAVAVGVLVVRIATPHHAPVSPSKVDVTVLNPVSSAHPPSKTKPLASGVAQAVGATAHPGVTPSRATAVASLASASPSTAPPATAGSDALAQAKAEVISASHNTASVISAAAGPQGLISVQYVVNGRNGVAWVDPLRKLVFLGTLLTADGQNLLDASTAMQEAAKSPAPNASAPANGASTPQAAATSDMAATNPGYQAQAILVAMDQTVGAHTGMSGEAPVWIFVDPDDPNSASFFNASMKKDLRNKASITWVPVAIQDPHSLARAVWILNQVGPAYAMKQNFRFFNKTNEQGGAPVTMTAPVMVKTILKNTKLLSDTGSLQTPAALFCTADGQPHVMYAPTDLAAILAIAGPCKGVVSHGGQQ